MLDKLTKLARLSAVSEFRRGLRHGVAATVEHRALLSSLNIATVVDIGANKGQFSLLARHLFPQATIYAFEPLERPATRFEQLFGNDRRTRLHRCAIGDRSGTADIHVSKREDSSSLLPIGRLQVEAFPETGEVGVQEIRIARLDECLSADDILSDALMKIDVQGFEAQVIDGSASLLPRFRYVYCEVSFVPLYEGQALAHEVYMRLAKHGFRLSAVNDVSIANGRPVQADMLFEQT